MNIGLVGCGSIGQFLLEKINEEKLFSDYRITSVLDDRESTSDKLLDLSRRYEFKIFQEIEAFLDAGMGIVVECANIKVAKEYACKIVEQKDLLLISIGALSDATLYKELHSIAKSKGTKVYLPSGAIGGLDIVKAANTTGGLEAVSLVTRKPADALSGKLLEKEMVIFEGPAKQAIQEFPQNANVAITLSLAGIGVDETRVKIIADPTISKNMHTIHATGEFGKLELTIENNPSPTNPKTSYLTGLSILSAIQSLEEQMVIG
ncbi:aspartate dehydrogenase [Sporosarcina sp. G11-34]|uniref:aspartate dehydrogenase n=1 Tax=Sporosarcina sp. G11-34 TaxID=2849605 RepID=UPI0022A923AD|nr:aspartate dehydrogenase [Sporosarcina sp. G11-34]MCZ2260286.1 aspartate dehydrogenase [Sporosarcina sp. G11-34]